MVHERDDRRTHAADEVCGQSAIGEAIDDEHGSGGYGAKNSPCLGQVVLRGIGKRARQLDVPRRNAELRQQSQHTAVVHVAAGRQVDVAGNGERSGGHATGPSKEARARSVSCSVTRILASSLPSSPSAPALAALAMASNT